jgi:hypothetical protein
MGRKAPDEDKAKGKASEQAAAALNVSPASVERAPGGGRMKTDPQAHDKAKAGTLPRAKAPKVKHLETVERDEAIVPYCGQRAQPGCVERDRRSRRG